VLDGMGWLSQASLELRNEIARRCDRITAAEVHSIYRAGDPAGGIFGIVSGRLDMHLPLWGSDRALAHVVGPGWWIGDLAAVTGEPRRFDILVQRDTRLLRLSRAEITRLCDKYPEMHQHLLLMAMANMRLLIDAAEALGLSQPVSRVSACLLRIDRGGPGWHGRLELTQGELASIAKLSRRRTNAALHELETIAALRLGYGKIEILDRPRLQALMYGDDLTPLIATS